MKKCTFSFEDYVNPLDNYHYARKELEATWPHCPHDHDFYELVLVEKGATFHEINNKTETLSRGALLFIRPHDKHRFCASPSDGCQIINIMFRPETASHLFSRYGEELGQRFFWNKDQYPDTFLLAGPRLERAINSMAELQMARRTLTRIEQFLLYMMTRVVDFAVTLPEGTPQWLVSACLAARTPEVFRLGSAGFVEAAGRGHEHVCRMTQKHLGMSPTQFVNRIRMEHAAMQLGSSNLPILEISIDCGIENLSHFYKLFREIYGNTPSQYRSNHRIDPIQPI